MPKTVAGVGGRCVPVNCRLLAVAAVAVLMVGVSNICGGGPADRGECWAVDGA